ncbi:Trp-DMAT domain containing protein [Pyrenophora tritici-repentis]|nr:Trp-DMAT domain containing protein [Pyrenophora tritici-repentis]
MASVIGIQTVGMAHEAPAKDSVGALMEKQSISNDVDGAMYWFRTSGQDLARMMQEASFPEETSRQFLTFYHDIICPLLANKPKSDSLPTAVGWDGNPFEYSFEFKGSTKKPGVRFVLDLSEARPPNHENQ